MRVDRSLNPLFVRDGLLTNIVDDGANGWRGLNPLFVRDGLLTYSVAKFDMPPKPDCLNPLFVRDGLLTETAAETAAEISAS